jgi:hypothetical protein
MLLGSLWVHVAEEPDYLFETTECNERHVLGTAANLAKGVRVDDWSLVP